MPEQPHVYDGLSTREGFNRSLKHFKFIMQVVAEFERTRNLADILSDRLLEKAIGQDQVLPTLNAILVDKYHYALRSHNLQENFEGFDAIASETGKWKAMDLVVVYFHPELGVVAVNPKNRSLWNSVQSLKKNELITVFAGAFQNTTMNPIFSQGIDLLIQIIEGGKVRSPSVFTKGRFTQKSPARPAVTVAPAPKRAARGKRVKGASIRPAFAPKTAQGAPSPVIVQPPEP